MQVVRSEQGRVQIDEQRVLGADAVVRGVLTGQLPRPGPARARAVFTAANALSQRARVSSSRDTVGSEATCPNNPGSVRRAADVVIMSLAGRVFVTGADVVRSVTGEEIDQEGIGGCEVHGRRSSVVHVLADDEEDAYVRARRITSLFARPGLFDLHAVRDEQDLRAALKLSALTGELGF